jgi:hypothetical protein
VGGQLAVEFEAERIVDDDTPGRWISRTGC